MNGALYYSYYLTPFQKKKK